MEIKGRLERLEKQVAEEVEPVYLFVLYDQPPNGRTYTQEAKEASKRAADAKATQPGGIRWCYPVANEDVGKKEVSCG